MAVPDGEGVPIPSPQRGQSMYAYIADNGADPAEDIFEDYRSMEEA